jgi:ribonuclease P protein subunit POP4
MHEYRFELFIPLHQLWMGYMSELLGLAPAPTDPAATSPVPSSTSMHPKLIKADYHGSIMTGFAHRSSCAFGLLIFWV